MRKNTGPHAARLRRLREALGLSQRELARELGVAHGAVGQWEAGRRPLVGPALKLVEAYEAELGFEGAPPRGIQGAPTSWAVRSLKVSGTAAAVAAHAMLGILVGGGPGNRISERAQAAIARRLVQTLGEMKGAVMKLGQMASYLDMGVPPAIRQALATLQTQSPSMSPAVVARIFVEELGEGPRRLFTEWSPTPFAAASIGQVHRARLSTGEEVAVKVQYPGVAAAIEADLDSAELLHEVAALLFRGLDPGPLMAELRTRLGEECDYRREAAHQERCRQLWTPHSEVRIPRVFPALSTERILVSEFARGEPLDAFAARASQAEKDRAGACIFRFAFRSMLRHALFNADPHPGNFLFDRGGVTFLDFGCTKRFDPAYVGRWRALLRAMLERDLDRATALTIELGAAPDPSDFDFEFHHRMNATLFEPLLTDGPFCITPAFVERTWRVGWAENRNRFRTNMPSEGVFLPRLQWGLFSVLARLEATWDWRAEILDILYDPDEPRPPPYRPREVGLFVGA